MSRGQMLRFTEAEFDARKRSPNGYVDTPVVIRRRGAHKSAYLFHASAYARAIGIAEPVGEWYFDDDREWRLDLAWPDAKVAIEIDGGIGQGLASHMSTQRVRESMEKLNAATLQGWRVLHAEPRDLAKAIAMASRLL